MYQTLVVDSASSAEIAARNMHRFSINPTSKDPRQWFGGSTDALELSLYSQLGSAPINVVLICHVDQDKDERMGTFVRNPRLPGRLRAAMSGAYSEFYRMYANFVQGQEGEVKRYFQTQTDPLYAAATRIKAPNPCNPTYEALWQNYLKKERPFVHFLIYGEPGIGKSTFAAGCPTPIWVAMFDSFGKDVCYLDRGEPQPLEQQVIAESAGNKITVPARNVLDRDGNLLIRLEYFQDLNPFEPVAYARFSARLTQVLKGVWDAVAPTN